MPRPVARARWVTDGHASVIGVRRESSRPPTERLFVVSRRARLADHFTPRRTQSASAAVKSPPTQDARHRVSDTLAAVPDPVPDPPVRLASSPAVGEGRQIPPTSCGRATPTSHPSHLAPLFCPSFFPYHIPYHCSLLYPIFFWPVPFTQRLFTRNRQWSDNELIVIHWTKLNLTMSANTVYETISLQGLWVSCDY